MAFGQNIRYVLKCLSYVAEYFCKSEYSTKIDQRIMKVCIENKKTPPISSMIFATERR